MIAKRVLLLLAVVASVAQAQRDPNDFCFECAGRRNHKDLYADPEDCHQYYACQYQGDGTALGLLQRCPSGQAWHQDILQCVAEGAVPCQDRCQESAVAERGCYAQAGNCAGYFVCSFGVSYPFCCPATTQFNATTCMCDASDVCLDDCQVQGPPEATTKAAPQVFDQECIDSFGVTLRPGQSPASFILVDTEDETQSVEKQCAPGSLFDLAQCQCATATEFVPEPIKPAVLYASFDDGQARDQSAKGVFVDAVDAEVSDEVAARGSGSLRLAGASSRVEIPASKNEYYRNQTNCLFFRCAEPPCSYSNAGVFTRRGCQNDANRHGYAVAFGAAANTLTAEVTCSPDNVFTSSLPLPDSVDTSAFIQLCSVHLDRSFSLYLNNQLVGNFPIPCDVPINHCPIMYGYDSVHGALNGYVDELFQVNQDIGAAGVDAHYQGQAALRNAGYIP